MKMDREKVSPPPAPPFAGQNRDVRATDNFNEVNKKETVGGIM